MFGISFNELLIVLALALIILGPDKLPELARTLGKGLGELKRATDDVTKTIMEDTNLKETAESLKQSMKVDTGISRDQLKTMFEDIEQGKGRPAKPPAAAPSEAEANSDEEAPKEPSAAPAEAKPAKVSKKPASKFADDDSE